MEPRDVRKFRLRPGDMIHVGVEECSSFDRDQIWIPNSGERLEFRCIFTGWDPDMSYLFHVFPLHDRIQTPVVINTRFLSMIGIVSRYEDREE